MIDIHKILLDGATFDFAIEIFARTLIMFFLILILLRLSGRRGVRQLTLFEVAIILGLGSAAGDPMFNENIPIIYSVLVLFFFILLYKIITLIAAHSRFVTKLMEGKEMAIVKDGMFNVEECRHTNFSQREFFAELRNHSIEHLGQVRFALLEVDGTLSVLLYDKNHIKYGMPLFPADYKKINPLHESGPYACMFCGNVTEVLNEEHPSCKRCKRTEWSKAINISYN